MKSFGVPMVLIGGGGYSLRNVARCWTYETSVALGVDLENEIPQNEYSMYFYPANKIHTPVSNQENMNSRKDVEHTTKMILENLKKVKATNVNLDYYHNGTPGPISNPLGYDKSELEQEKSDNNKDVRPKDTEID